MRIHFERSGGVTGIPIKATIDSQTLTGEETQRLQELMQAVDFFDLPAHLIETSPLGGDQFYYIVTIADEGQANTIKTTDSAAPADLRPLLHQLTLLARRS
jgi:hypothetical protein